MTDDQQHALQEQRHREALVVEMAGLRQHEARARWCEERKADVKYYPAAGEWIVQYMRGFHVRTEIDPDRNTAIDRAMQEGK